MRNLVLTLDYELYGNGSGDVFRHIIEPTNRILEVAQKYGAKFTIFFEVIEYWKLKEEWYSGNKMGYDRNPIEAMEQQIVRAYKDGHDIQLHLHPQWVNAHWTDDGWNVDLSQWRLGDYNGSCEWSLVSLLKRGKSTLEAIINDDNYTCHTLRAGGYNVQPSHDLAMAMKEAGLKVDSSVYPGGKEAGHLSRYDYTEVPLDCGMWYCDDCLEKSSNKIKDLMEFPIVAFPFIRFKKYMSYDRIKSILGNRKSAKDSFEAKTGLEKGSLLNKIKFFFLQEALTWDYCLFTNSMHRFFLQNIDKQEKRDVFVLVGHPKSFVSEKGLIYLLTHTDNYRKISINQYLKSIKKA